MILNTSPIYMYYKFQKVPVALEFVLECPKSPVLESDHPAILDGEQVLNRWAGLAQNTQNSKFSLISVNYTEYVAKLAEICLFLHILSQNWREVYLRALQCNAMHWWEGLV